MNSSSSSDEEEMEGDAPFPESTEDPEPDPRSDIRETRDGEGMDENAVEADDEEPLGPLPNLRPSSLSRPRTTIGSSRPSPIDRLRTGQLGRTWSAMSDSERREHAQTIPRSRSAPPLLTRRWVRSH